MNQLSSGKSTQLFQQIAWWLLLAVCLFYSAFAFIMGGVELLSLLGWAVEAKARATPVIFLVHAFSGGIALLCAPLQFQRTILSKRRNLHRRLGRIYVWSIWIASVGGLWSALFFNVNLAAKIGFGILSILWFATTALAFLRIRQRRVAEHREWMIRSFALSFFFVTFSFWVPGLTSTALPHAISYPLAVFLSWAVNLLVAEVWIRRTQSRTATVASGMMEWAVSGPGHLDKIQQPGS